MLPTEVWTPRRSTVRFNDKTVDSPTPGSSDSDTTSALGFQRLNAASGLNPSMAIVIVTLMASFFFLAFISIYMKRCASSQAEGEAGAGASPSRQHDPPLRGGGLEKTFIDSFPLLSYSAMKGLRQGCDPSECCVCLTEFVEDESLRMLPKCGHSFHPDCIDMWLYSHSSCPLCRQSLVLLPQEILSFAIFTQEACGRATEGSNAAATDAQGEVRINIDEILAENEASGAERDSSRAAGRVGERETALILSRNSEISRKAAQDLERMQNSSLSYASVAKNSPSASDCLRRSLSVGESGRSLRKAVGLKRDAYSPQKAAEADGTLFGSRLQHAESCSMLVELISRHQEAEGDKNLRGRE